MDPRLQRARQQKAGAAKLDRRALAAFERGEAPFASVLGVDADRIALFRDRGLALLEGGRIAEAKTVLEMCALFGDTDPAISIALACCAHLLGDRKEAELYARDGVERAINEGHSELAAAASAWVRDALEESR